MFQDLADPHSARIVLTTAMLANTLECFDDLEIEPTGDARKHAEGVLKMMGPGAVFTALLQAAPPLQESERVGGFVDVFVDAAVRRRQGLIEALPADDRERVLTHEPTRSVEPSRVIELFQQALEGSSLPDAVKKLSAGLGAGAMEERVSALAERGGIRGAPEADAEARATIPRDALGALGDAFARAGLDEDALARVLDGVLPPDAPAGYRHDGAGTLTREQPKTGRNDPCPCGSGRKYKKCHGRARA